MDFQNGDKVRFLNEVGEGVIINIANDQALVETEDGFEYWVQLSELVPNRSLNVESVEVKDREQRRINREKTRAPEYLEKDLHFTQLVDFPKNYDRYQMLQIQLSEARKTLDKARKSGVKRVILIHGVGEGRLREEVHSMLERMDRLEFFNADFNRYGLGATEVELY